MLSVVITAWNEEKNIARAISSAISLADEIVVVDTQSTDDTIAIARKLGAKVYRHKFTGIVEPVRNYSISKARGDWILLLDADEEISPSLAAKIRQAISDPQADYYRLPRKNIIFSQWITSSHWWPDYVYRLFRKGSITWDPAIHSLPYTRGTGRDFPPSEPYALIHHNYDSISQFIDRLNRYTDHQPKPEHFFWPDLISKPIGEFLSQYFARQGYKNGLHGLVLSLLQAFSTLVLYLKLWEQTGFKPQEVSPQQLNQQLAMASPELKWWLYESKINSSPFIFRPFLKLARKLSL